MVSEAQGGQKQLFFKKSVVYSSILSIERVEWVAVIEMVINKDDMVFLNKCN